VPGLELCFTCWSQNASRGTWSGKDKLEEQETVIDVLKSQLTEILCKLDWIVNHKRVYCILRWEDLQLPQKRQKGKRYNGNGLNACVGDRRSI